MKQYTTPEQTAKLIELGFAPNAKIKEVRVVHSKVKIDHDCNFTIGELIEMLPRTIIVGCTTTQRLMFSLAFYGWEIGYLGMGMGEPIVFQRAEFIDTIYDLIIRLKEEGVI